MAKIPESELIINSDGSVFHLHIKPEELADRIVLVGDPGRVGIIRNFFSEIEYEGCSREFNFVTGKYNGKRITALSSGIGTDNIDIVMTELDALANVDFATREVKNDLKSLSIIRIGTCGAIRPEIPVGSYILSEMALGFDGLLNWYQDSETIFEREIETEFIKYMDWKERLATPYFVSSSPEIVDRFKDSAFCGITMSAPGFYGPQGRTVRLKPIYDTLVDKLEKFSFEGHYITNIEMESSAIFGFSKMLGHKASTICLVVANRYCLESNPDYKPLMDGLVKLVLDRI